MLWYLDGIWSHLYTDSNTDSGDENMDSRKIEKRIEKMEAAECPDYALLRRWAEHPDALIREQVAAVLVFGAGEPGREILLKLAADSEELVRAEAFPCSLPYAPVRRSSRSPALHLLPGRSCPAGRRWYRPRYAEPGRPAPAHPAASGYQRP